ncbi:hypothetical protein ACFX2H_019437 [Malus domestica]
MERLESIKLQTKATCYYMWNDILVRRSYTRPYLHCLASLDDLKILCSIHKGVYGNHSGSRSLAHKAFNAGTIIGLLCIKTLRSWYKNTMLPTLQAYIIIHANELHPQTSHLSFIRWAIDLVGPMLPTTGGRGMMIVATD